MKSIWDSNLREFRDKTASHEPVPGGGSVAAVTAVYGLSLVLMALEVNVRRKEPHPEAEETLASGKLLMGHLSACADEDVAAFEAYLQALLLPKNTPAEEQARLKALSVAASGATEAPLHSAELCLEGLILARKAIDIVHSAIASDVGAGAAMLYGALTATLYNVDVNLRGLEVMAHRNEASSTRKDLQQRADQLAYVIQKETLAKISR